MRKRGVRIKRSVFTVILLVSLCSVPCARGVVMEWPVAAGGNGHFYEAVAGQPGISWEQAQAAAQAAGGHLVTITSQAENDFVFHLIDDPVYWTASANVRGPWIGGFQLPGSVEPDGGWSWVTGEPFAYDNWDVGQPNEWQNNNENRIHFGNQSFRTDTWNDVPQDFVHVKSYVVEYVPEPGTVCLLGLGVLGLREKRRRLRT